MEPISQVNPMLEALRRQLAENIERMRKAGKLAAAGRGQGAREPAPAGGEPLEAVLRRRIAPLDRRSPEGLAACTRAFVETVLTAEFGQGLLSDPGLGELLTELSASLREDAEIREQLDRMLTEI